MNISWRELLGSAGSSPLVQRRAQGTLTLSMAYRW